MNRVAVIGGSGVLEIELFAGLKKREIETGYGRVMVEEGKGQIISPEEGAKDVLLVVR